MKSTQDAAQLRIPPLYRIPITSSTLILQEIYFIPHLSHLWILQQQKPTRCTSPRPIQRVGVLKSCVSVRVRGAEADLCSTDVPASDCCPSRSGSSARPDCYPCCFPPSRPRGFGCSYRRTAPACGCPTATIPARGCAAH